MSAKATKYRQQDKREKLRQELLYSCNDILFEVHQGAPSFWNSDLDQKLEIYLQGHQEFTYTTCPICGHKIKGPQFPQEFHDPWWIYPQKGFYNSDTCSHFEALSFSILWVHSEPIGAPWIIPCGWGVPALTESLMQNENLEFSVKISPLNNGAAIFWYGFFRQQPGIPLFSDLWPLPILKTRTPIRPSLNSRGYWSEFSPLTNHTPAAWSKLYIIRDDDTLVNYESKKDTSAWLQKIRTWNQLAYTQPLKMFGDRFVAESGLASFAIGMRSSRTKGALFISQAPIFANVPVSQRKLEAPVPQHTPFIQPLNLRQMRDFAATDTLWAIMDPFQNEAIQDWIRLIKKLPDAVILPLWRESEMDQDWMLAADSSISASLKNPDLVDFYRDLSPLLTKVTPDVLELSLRYSLGGQSWGAFFISSSSIEDLHSNLRHKLVCNYQGNWVYFRFYETNFITAALSILSDSELYFFYGPIAGWITRDRSESKYTLYTHTLSAFKAQEFEVNFAGILPRRIHETAQRVYQFDQPRRIKEFIKDRTPEFSELISEHIINRWVRESVRQAHHWGIRKEPHLIKFFLWKVLITPTWCHLPPFVRILQQSVAEEVKVQNIEVLFPQLKLSEIPRNLTIESWDAELWDQLRKHHSPLGNADPEAFHPMLGEKPPAMPLHNHNWLKTVGLFYENAYADLSGQSGIQLLDSVFETEVSRPLHPPPRMVSLSATEIVIRDEGSRSQVWLKQHGFENLASTQGNWIHRSPNSKATLLLVRQFLEEFPYVDSRFIFDFLSPAEKKAVMEYLEIFTIYWDSHHFWLLNKM
jgi:hypothetical protein